MVVMKSAYQRMKQEGYLIIPEIFRGNELEELRNACNEVLEQFTEEHDQQHPNTDFMYMRNIHDSRWFHENKEQRKTILEAIADPRCVGTVENIFAGPSLFRSISYMVNPRYSSEAGNWHRDTQFIVKDEQEERVLLQQYRKAEIVTGVHLQLALVDNDDIEYVPYSANRYDSPDEAYFRLDDNKSHCHEEGMPNALRVALKAGDGVIFDPYGLHRGRYYKEIPRRSLHITYTRQTHPINDEFILQPWFDEPGYLDGLSPRAAGYYQQFADVYRGSWSSGTPS